LVSKDIPILVLKASVRLSGSHFLNRYVWHWRILGPRRKVKLCHSSKIKLHLKNRKFIHLYKEVFRLRSLTGKDL